MLRNENVNTSIPRLLACVSAVTVQTLSRVCKLNTNCIECIQWEFIHECKQWFHVRTDCCDLSHEMYEILANSTCSWICPLCGLPNFSDPFFDNSLHSLCLSNSFDPLDGCDAEVSPTLSILNQTPIQGN